MRAECSCPFCDFSASELAALEAHVIIHFNLPGSEMNAQPMRDRHAVLPALTEEIRRFIIQRQDQSGTACPRTGGMIDSKEKKDESIRVKEIEAVVNRKFTSRSENIEILKELKENGIGENRSVVSVVPESVNDGSCMEQNLTIDAESRSVYSTPSVVYLVPTVLGRVTGAHDIIGRHSDQVENSMDHGVIPEIAEDNISKEFNLSEAIKASEIEDKQERRTLAKDQVHANRLDTQMDSAQEPGEKGIRIAQDRVEEEMSIAQDPTEEAMLIANDASDSGVVVDRGLVVASNDSADMVIASGADIVVANGAKLVVASDAYIVIGADTVVASGAGPWICQYCDRIFPEYIHMARHEAAHMYGTRFKC